MKLLTIDEAAERVHSNVGTLRFWRATRPEGYPTGFKIGKRLVYDEAELVAFVERMKAAESAA